MRKPVSFRSSRAAFLSSHSQTVSTRKPSRLSSLAFLASLLRLPAIFAVQNVALVYGILPTAPPFVFRQFGWPCQKHPWTKIAQFRDLFERSGRPGREGEFDRNRWPSRDTACRIASSAAVPSRPTACIISRRLARLTMSDGIEGAQAGGSVLGSIGEYRTAGSAAQGGEAI